MRSKLTTIIEIVGVTLVAAGVSLIAVPAGLVVAGLALVGIGYVLGQEGDA